MQLRRKLTAAGLACVTAIAVLAGPASAATTGSPYKSGGNAKGYAAGHANNTTHDMDRKKCVWYCWYQDGTNVNMPNGFGTVSRAGTSGTHKYRHQVHGDSPGQAYKTLTF